MIREENKSYKQIIKSTSIFGGSQIITILVGILRNKVVAILLGSFGIGLISMYQIILDLVKSISTLGIETGGVREIATTNSLSSEEELQKIISLVDKWSLILAFIGAFVCILFSYPISLWTFDDSSHILSICLLAVCVFFSILTAGQIVVLHGLRQISKMVRASIAGSLLSLIISLPLYYFFRLNGIIPAFILMSIGMYLAAVYYRRKINIESVPLPISSILRGAKPLFRIGLFIVISSVLTTAGYFFIRTFLSKELGLVSVGLFQAAWSVTNVYLMLILKSMGSDFFPRLCSVINSNEDVRKLVNEQTYIVLIVSVPLIITLLLLSKIILVLLYSSEFASATPLLSWQIVGTFFKVLSWPLGFIILAKGKGQIYFVSEMFYLLIYLIGSFGLYPIYGFDAVGIAYMIAYVLYLVAVFFISINLSQFKWTLQNIRIGLTGLIMILAVFITSQFYSQFIFAVGIPVVLLSFIGSLLLLNKVLPLRSFFESLKK